MSMQLINAINNRDASAMAKMAGSSYEPERVLSSEAEDLVDTLFRQLKQLFPASVSTALKSESQERTTKRQWIAAFAENGITTKQQLSAGLRHARSSDSDFWPSPGKFIKWCKDSSVALGITLDDAMNEFRRYNRDKSLHAGGPELFPWSKPVLYWIVCDARRAMYQRQLGEVEVEKLVSKLLDEWSGKVAAGGLVPDPVASLEVKKEVIPTENFAPEYDGKTHCMPNAAVLGSVTPAEWLHREYKRRKAAGLV